MDDNTPQLANSDASSSRSMAALRELEERARSARAAQRGQLARVEVDINKRLEAIVAAIGNERALEQAGAQEVESARQENAQLRKEAKEGRAEIERLRQAVEARESALEREQAARAEQIETSAADRDSLARERDELQQKFDLALQDVQRFRGRVAELEQDLARRPEPNQADSAELVSLRAERDALAQRVEELEQVPAPSVDSDSAQQLADLQRRFEMAVEDVRELKTKNSKLEAQLAKSAQRTSGVADNGAMDWESQKRRLLATLEQATSGDDPLPEKERVSIAGTIEMTDAVIAQKDREIERLKADLASQHHPLSAEPTAQQQIDELLDTDEVIAEHRQRIIHLEREAEEKLRAAELELSVERAKLARQRAELDGMRSDLESQRQAMPTNAAAVAGAPRRRWLSKLGINGNEQ